MPILYEPTVYCDECNLKKGENNHWFCFIITNKGPIFTPFVDVSIKKGKDKVLVYCGQNCISKAFGRLLDTGNIEKPIKEIDTGVEISVEGFEESARLIEDEELVLTK